MSIRVALPLISCLGIITSCQTQHKNVSSLQDICGSNDLQPVLSAQPKAPWSKELLLKLEPSVVAIKDKSGSYYCSGSLIGADLVLTAEHCLGWRRAKDLVVSFNYQGTTDGQGLAEREDFEVLQLLEAGAPTLDYALLRLKKNAAGEQAGQRYPVLPLNFEAVPLGADIMVIQHPLGGPKRVDSGHVSGDGGLRMQFNDLDAETGSSGSPVLNLQGEVVGVHTHGGCKAAKGANKAFRLSEIFKVSPLFNPRVIAPLQENLPAEIPDGDVRGIRFEKLIEDKGRVNQLEVSFAVDHKFFNQLSFILIAPSGARVTLRDRASDGQLGLTKMSFPAKEPLDSFDILKGEPSAGLWQLLVIDRGEGQKGKLLDWNLKVNP